MEYGTVSSFIKNHFRHFNAAVVVDAAEGYKDFISSGGQMMITLAGAMSRAEIGLSLADMIRRNKVHAICCTGANLPAPIWRKIFLTL